MAVSLYSTLSRRNTLIFSCHASAVGFVTDCEHVRTKKSDAVSVCGLKMRTPGSYILPHKQFWHCMQSYCCFLCPHWSCYSDTHILGSQLAVKKICNLIHCLFVGAFWPLILLSSLFFYFSRPRDFRTPFFFSFPCKFSFPLQYWRIMAYCQ